MWCMAALVHVDFGSKGSLRVDLRPLKEVFNQQKDARPPALGTGYELPVAHDSPQTPSSFFFCFFLITLASGDTTVVCVVWLRSSMSCVAARTRPTDLTAARMGNWSRWPHF